MKNYRYLIRHAREKYKDQKSNAAKCRSVGLFVLISNWSIKIWMRLSFECMNNNFVKLKRLWYAKSYTSYGADRADRGIFELLNWLTATVCFSSW